jgi:hypothetical protein
MLAANLGPKECGYKEFKDSCALRWRAGTGFRRMKINLQPGNFSGSSELAIKQDSCISCIRCNMVALLALESDEATRNKASSRKKHPHKTSFNIVINGFAAYFGKIAFCSAMDAIKYIEDIIAYACKTAFPR